MTKSLGFEGKTAAEISASLIDALKRGGFSPGDLLPTVRDLAERLEVNRNTVAAAYRKLTDLGVVETDGRRGTRIAMNLPSPNESRHEAVINLSNGNPDQALLPNLNAALRSLTFHHRNYEDQDRPELLTIGRTLFEADALPVGGLSLANGAFDAMFRALTVSLQPGAHVAVEDPCFITTLGLLEQLHLKPVPMALDEDGVRPEAMSDALDQGAKALILTPRAHNPTGASWSAARHDALAKVIARYPATLLIEDDHFAPLSLAAPMSLASAHDGPWAIIRSVSKYLGPDFRMAFVNAHPDLHGKLVGLSAFSNRWVSDVLQMSVAALMRDTGFADMLRRAAAIYQNRQKCLVAALAGRGIKTFGEDGINIWIPVADEATTSRRLLELGWLVRPGAIMRLKAPPGIRVTSSGLSDEQIERFARDLASLSQDNQIVRSA